MNIDLLDHNDLYFLRLSNQPGYATLSVIFFSLINAQYSGFCKHVRNVHIFLGSYHLISPCGRIKNYSIQLVVAICCGAILQPKSCGGNNEAKQQPQSSSALPQMKSSMLKFGRKGGQYGSDKNCSFPSVH